MARSLSLVSFIVLVVLTAFPQSGRFVQLNKDGKIVNLFPADNTVEVQTDKDSNNGRPQISIYQNGALHRHYNSDAFDSFDIVDIPDNEIWYTTTHGRKLQPASTFFGANLISNEYSNNKGVLRFDDAVTSIPDEAFTNFTEENNMGLQTMLLPRTVQQIGTSAFYRCLNLSYINIPESVTFISTGAFMCTNLTEITLPDNVRFGDNPFCCNPQLHAFYSTQATEDHRCLIENDRLVSIAPSGLQTYSIPEGVKIIDWLCFGNYSNFTNITLPTSLCEIKEAALEGVSVKNWVIPEGVEIIHKWAFRSNDVLESLTLPQSLKNLGESIVTGCPRLKFFYGKYSSCKNKGLVIDGKLTAIAPFELTEFTTTEDVKIIGYATFWGVESVKRINICSPVEIIENDAFFACSNLEYISFPTTLHTVGDRIISSCDNLSKLSGSNVSEDGRCLIIDGKLYGFAGKGLVNYTVPSGIKEIRSTVFTCNYSLKSVNLPEGLEVICNDAFRICPALESITLPSSIKVIGEWAHGMSELFHGCTSLSKVFCKTHNVPLLSCPLTIQKFCNIYVPESAIEDYKNDINWNQYPIFSYNPDYNETIYESIDYSEDGKCVVLQKATKGAGIDIFIMGDGYTDRLVKDGTYHKHMKQAMDYFFSEEPYVSFKDYFNVYCVTTVSKNEEFSPYSSTALNCNFGYGTSVGGNNDKCTYYASNTGMMQDLYNSMLIVVLNSKQYAGTTYMQKPYWSEKKDYGIGTSFAYVPIGENDQIFREGIVHEAAGHGFAKLADEYFYDGTMTENDKLDYEMSFDDGWWKNIDFSSNPKTVKWSQFLDDIRYEHEGLGIFEGACTFAYGAYRSTDYSIMRFNTGGFNAPSRQAIYYRIHKLALGDNWQYNHEEYVKWDENYRNSPKYRSTSNKPYNSMALNRKPLSEPVVIYMEKDDNDNGSSNKNDIPYKKTYYQPRDFQRE